MASGTDESLSQEARHWERWNFRLGVANGVAFTMVDAILAPAIVLPIFLSRLTDSHLLIGLPPAIINAGWLLPQLIIASRVSHLPRKMGWYTWPGVVRVIAMSLLGLGTWLLGPQQPGLMLALFFTLYTTLAVGAGVAGVPWLEAVGKTIAPRRRGTFFGLRNSIGGALAFLLSGVIGVIIAQGDTPGSPLTYPNNFAVLFGLAAVLATVGVVTWGLVREPADPTPGPRQRLLDQIRQGPALLRNDPPYRALLFARLLMAFSGVAGPFYVVYAAERLGAAESVVGFYLAAITISSVVSNALWSPIANRASPRTLMRLNAAATGMIPVLALGLPPVLLALGLLGPGSDTPGARLFALVFVLVGFANAGSAVINNNLLLMIAPPAQRPLYIGFLNTILGIATLVPILGGLLVDQFGYEPVFALAVGLAAGAFVLSGNLTRRA